jgi:ABC-type sulfate transport system permease component
MTLKANGVLFGYAQFAPRNDVTRALNDMQTARTMTGFATPQMFGQFFVKHPLAVRDLSPYFCDINVAIKADFAAHILGFDFCQRFWD